MIYAMVVSESNLIFEQYNSMRLNETRLSDVHCYLNVNALPIKTDDFSCGTFKTKLNAFLHS